MCDEPATSIVREALLQLMEHSQLCTKGDHTESADLLFPQFGEHKQIVRCRKRAAELLETDGERGPLAAHAGLQTTA